MNILVVDDQEDVVQSIANGMDWIKLGIAQVYTANNAREAKMVIASSPVDILLSDIEMPEESGLELFEWVRKNNYEMECVFLTSHADFHYAQKAIHLGSFDYILQPARFEEVDRILTKVIGKINQDQKMELLKKKQDMISYQQDIVLEGIFDKLFSAKSEEAEGMFEHLPDLFKNKYESGAFYIAGLQITRWKKNQQAWNSDLVRMVLRNVLEEIFNDCRCELLISKAGEFDYIVMFYGDTHEFIYETFSQGLRTMHHFVQDKMEFELAVYMGGKMENSLHDTVHLLARMLYNNVIKDARVFEISDLKPVNPADLKRLNYNTWTEWLSEGQGEAVKNELEAYLQAAMKRGQLTLEVMKQIHYYFTKAFFATLEKNNMKGESVFDDHLTYDEYMDSYKSYECMMSALEYCINHLAIYTTDEGAEDRIEAAKRFIADNINKNVTRSEVAASVYLNEEYFSRLFKKETGYVFKDYVNMEKINYAKNYLEKTSFSISIVGSKVGYDNFSYFSKVFKKFEGMTPQEYRQIHKK